MPHNERPKLGLMELFDGHAANLPATPGRITSGVVFGRYEVGPLLGKGGMGTVYRARDLMMGRDVALKVLPGGQQTSTIGRSLFQKEIRAFAKLDHPHVVPIYEAGENDGLNYFTMKLLPSDLKTQLRRFEGDPVGAAVLVEKIALAVHHLHQHGILHRDLKPANILLDASEPPNPYVADFGVAKHLDEDSLLGTGRVVGTPLYMAPEQAAGESVTWATDIYSIGVILYELLTRERPFQGSEREREREQERAKQKPPRDPRELDPRIDRDLARICLRCLDTEPESRYPSAEALAVALRRYLTGEPFEAASRVGRVWRWCLRHSVLTGLILGMVSFLVLVTLRVVTLLGEQEAAKREWIRQANMNGAAMVAGTVLAQMHALSDAVERAASEQELVLARALEDGDQDTLQDFCATTYAHYEDPSHGLKLNLWLVMDEEGILRAQYGKLGRPDNLGENYEWRDYFIGAEWLANEGRRGTHVSLGFMSESDGNHKFAISTPVYDEEGRWRGIVVGAIASEPKLGSLVLDDHSVLVAPRDIDREDKTGPKSGLIVLRHPAFEYGEAVGFDDDMVHQVGAIVPGRERWVPAPERVISIEGYRDPVAKTHPEYAGNWTAGLAPVGNTGYVVIVQTREDETMRLERTLAAQLAIWTGLSAIPGALLVGFAALYSRHRRRVRGIRRSSGEKSG